MIDYYVFPDHDLNQVRQVLEKLLNVRFIEHESIYWGEYFLSQSEIELKIFTNVDPIDGEEIFLEFPVRKTILMVTRETSSEDLSSSLYALEVRIFHLKREIY